MKAPRGLTPYQFEILQHLQRAKPAEPLDFDQLLELLSWQPSKEAAQFSFRALTRKGLIAKTEKLYLRRGRQRVCFVLMPEGALALDPRVSAGPMPAGAEGVKLVPGVSVIADLEEISGFPELEEVSIPEPIVVLED